MGEVEADREDEDHQGGVVVNRAEELHRDTYLFQEEDGADESDVASQEDENGAIEQGG